MSQRKAKSVVNSPRPVPLRWVEQQKFFCTFQSVAKKILHADEERAEAARKKEAEKLEKSHIRICPSTNRPCDSGCKNGILRPRNNV